MLKDYFSSALFAPAILALAAPLFWPPPTAAGDMAEEFSHADWTAVLQKFVDPDGLVDYQGLARDRTIFDRYVSAIETVGPRSAPRLFPTRDHALAYYVNAYNAQVFAGVLRRGPEKKSVWSGLISGLNFFSRMKIVVDGERTNLKNLEEKRILEQFRDPRVHSALNCASIGCPRLARRAFEAEMLDTQLDATMTGWVNDERHCRVDEARRSVALNKIFDWFSSDFLSYERSRGVGDPNQIDYLNRFRAESAQIPRDYAIEFLPYDKGINAR